MLSYICIQFFLPYSHFITKGYNNWTNGLYGYSWDMMVHSWETVLVSVKVIDNGNGKAHYLEPYSFSETDRWTKHADMAFQYAKCINENLKEEFANNKKSILTSNNFSIYFDIWTSMNGRFQQRIFNPEVDILNARWSPFEQVDWVLLLLTEFSSMRNKMAEITDNVLSWNNYTDVMFIADFPRLKLLNYISPDFDNVTLTLLEGAVRFESENSTKMASLSKDQSTKVLPGVFHSVKTTSATPSCYMYIYTNRTMQILNTNQHNQENPQNEMLPLHKEFSKRLENYIKFFQHVGNSLLFEIYGVPMPRRIKEMSEK